MNKKIELQNQILFNSINKKYTVAQCHITWLLGSLLFFFIASVVAPFFWPQMDKAGQVSADSTFNLTMGIAGIIVYFSEPVIWHFNLLTQNKGQAESNLRDEVSKSGVFKNIVSIVAPTAINLVIMLPAMIISMFKPVLRALVLFTSLSLFGSMKDDTALYKFFVVVVTTDILLYYITQFAPNWKYNPVNIVLKLLDLQNKQFFQVIANFLLVIHTALIYSLLLAVVYYDVNKHPEKLKLQTLAIWWLVLTVYNRLSFSPGFSDEGISFDRVSRRTIIITALTLIISFIGFLWPFYFR